MYRSSLIRSHLPKFDLDTLVSNIVGSFTARQAAANNVDNCQLNTHFLTMLTFAVLTYDLHPMVAVIFLYHGISAMGTFFAGRFIPGTK